jgi:GNAT superfamily N-acetyltransferase
MAAAEPTLREGLEGLTPARILTLYRRAPLMRSVHDPAAVEAMFASATFVVSAWHGDRLVGLARVLSDGVLFSFLCDLAVEPDVQGVGIGRQLIDAVLERCRGTELVLRDSEISAPFYERIGFERVGNAWTRQA